MKNDIKFLLNYNIVKIIILGLIVQIFSISSIFSLDRSKFNDYIQLEGQVTNQWIKDIKEKYSNTDSPSSALESAYSYSRINVSLQSIQNQYCNDYPDNQKFIKEHFSKLNRKTNKTYFTYILGYDYILKSNQYFLITILILIIMLFSNGEDQIKELRLSTKQNRNKYKINKLKINVFVSSGIWLLYTFSIFIIIASVLGFHGGNVWYKDWIQGFNPYGFTVLEYTIRVLILSLLTTVTLTFIVTAISLYCKKNISMIVSIIFLWVPPLIFNNTSLGHILYYFPVNFISGGYLHMNLEGLFIFNTFIPSYCIAVMILMFCLVISFICILRKDLRKVSWW